MEAFRMHVSPSSTHSRKDYLANSGGTNVMAVLVRPCRSRAGRPDTTPAGQAQLADVPFENYEGRSLSKDPGAASQSIQEMQR